MGFDVNIAGHAAGAPGSFLGTDHFKDAARKQRGKLEAKDAPASVWDVPGLEAWHGKDIWLDDALAREASDALAAAVRDCTPFFLSFCPYGVHTPIMGKPEVVAKYQAKKADRGHSNPVYAALVESVDDSVGALRAKLKELSLDQNTIFIFTSDNGGLSHQVRSEGWSRGPTDNSPARLGKGSAYEGGVHIPLIVAWPGLVKPGSTCDVPVITYDHVPTLLAATQTPLKKEQVLDGESLLPLLGQTDTLAREAIYWHYPHYHPGSARPYSAIREGEWKLIQFHEDNHVELYNLKLDAGESDNRAPFDAVRAMQLRDKLNAWLKDTGAQIPERNPKYDPDKPLNEPKKGKGEAKKKAE
jgi:arylsulfatase A-like enzyme